MQISHQIESKLNHQSKAEKKNTILHKQTNFDFYNFNWLLRYQH